MAESEKSLKIQMAIYPLLAVAGAGLYYRSVDNYSRRLESLADHGNTAEATVTKVDHEGGTHYKYAVNGTDYTWDVARDDAPYALGEKFAVEYLPEDPELNLPATDRSQILAKATEGRTFGYKVALVLLIFGFSIAGFARLALYHLRSKTAPDIAYRQRMIAVVCMLVPFLVLITESHIQDAIKKGEPLTGAIVGGIFGWVLVGGIFYYLGFRNQQMAQDRAFSMMRWVGPLAVVASLLRFIALMF